MAEQLSSDLLAEIHDIRTPFPKGKKIDWQAAWDLNWDTPKEAKRQLFVKAKPAWKQLSQGKADIKLPSPNDSRYLEQCVGLIWLIDQAGAYFKGIDLRWSPGYFRPITDKIVLEMYHAEESPFDKTTWLKRGFTFEEFIARIFYLSGPFVHSEDIMRGAFHLEFTHKLRSEVEAFTGQKDPGADSEKDDAQDIKLFDHLITNPPTKVEDMAQFVYPMLRIDTAHMPLINKFGRYPYRNDSLGRDFTSAEEEWINGTDSFNRMDLETREAIRKDVDACTWTPLKLDYDL